MATDVIIVGAGAAGLAAAERLCAAGVQVEIIEARPRLGGRICTRHDPILPIPIEGGAEFVHGMPPETWNIIQASHLPTCDVPETRLHFVHGTLQDRPDFWSRVEKVMSRLDHLDRDMSFAQFLRTRCRGVSAQDRALALSYVEGFNAADGSRISSQGLAKASEAEEQIEGDRLFRVLAGYDSVVAGLAAPTLARQAPIHLNTTVREIRWKPGRVDVVAQRSATRTPLTLRTRRVLITLPVSILQARSGESAVRFRPAVPAKQQAAGRLAMGNVVKAVLIFREPFWEGSLPTARKTPTRDTAFFHTTEPGIAFPTWWTMLPVRTTALVGWAGGPPADRLARLSEGRILAAALQSVSRITGLKQSTLAALLQVGHIFEWQRDPFARGAYSYIPVGGLDAPGELARPVDQTLFFAGEATHTGMSGTVAGAIASGYRAATEILADSSLA